MAGLSGIILMKAAHLEIFKTNFELRLSLYEILVIGFTDTGTFKPSTRLKLVKCFLNAC